MLLLVVLAVDLICCWYWSSTAGVSGAVSVYISWAHRKRYLDVERSQRETRGLVTHSQ